MNHDEIRAWVDAHDEVLSMSLAEISRFPIPIRKAIVGRVSPEKRLALWREHFLSVVETNPQFTPEQQAFVKESSEGLPEIFAAPAPNPVILAWEGRMSQLFTRSEAGRYFGTLGPPEPPEGLPLPPDVQPRAAR